MASGKASKRCVTSCHLKVCFAPIATSDDGSDASEVSGRPREIEASDLATVIALAPDCRLTSITLHQVTVHGDFSLVTRALSDSKYLEEFCTFDFRPRKPSRDLAALGVALAELPRLKDIHASTWFRASS